MTQGLRMIVEPDYHRNIDPLGDWDGTWDESFVYVIYDAYGYQEARRGYGDLIHKRTSVGDAMIRCKSGIESDVDAASIGQFTGLYDKDGEELYEGDIIRSYDSEGNSILHHIEYRGAS